MKYRYSFLLSLASLSLTSCSNNPVFVSSILTSSHEPIASKKLYAAADSTKPDYDVFHSEGYQDYKNALNQFGASISTPMLSLSNEDNPVISPLSISMALQMTAYCAANETRAELLDALGVDYEEMINYVSHLYNYVNREFTAYDYETDRMNVVGRELLTNSIWFQNGLNLDDNALQTLASQFHVTTFESDFANDADGVKEDLDHFIRENTNNLLGWDNDISPLVEMILLNTLYMKDNWIEGGEDIGLTPNTYIFNNGKEQIESHLMMKSGSGLLDKQGNYTHARIATEHGFNLHFLLPDEGYEVGEILDASAINEALNFKFKEDEVDYETYEKTTYTQLVSFPSYESSYHGSIVQSLKHDCGIQKLFNPSECDFTTVARENSLYAEDVIHAAKVKVERGGIEGAAYTAVMMAETAIWVDHEVIETIILDRPFAYLIDDSFGNLLFTGVVNNINVL